MSKLSVNVNICETTCVTMGSSAGSWHIGTCHLHFRKLALLPQSISANSVPIFHRKRSNRYRRCQSLPLKAAKEQARSAAAAPGLQGSDSSTQGRSAGLELQEKSYRVIHLEGCDYLIARTSEGKLDLRDVFVQDKELGISSRPQVVGDVPEQPLYFQEWPWVVEFTGDRVNGKMPWKRVEKMFLVEIVPPTEDSDYSLNLERIYELHHKRKDVRRGEVHKSASINDDTDPMEITLRITRNGFYLELLREMPDIEDIVVAEEQRMWEAEQAQARQKSAASVASTLGGKDMEATADAVDPMIEADPSDPDAALDPIDAMSENDFDGPDDTPAVDLGF